jgi:hypothetical protein
MKRNIETLTNNGTVLVATLAVLVLGAAAALLNAFMLMA